MIYRRIYYIINQILICGLSIILQVCDINKNIYNIFNKFNDKLNNNGEFLYEDSYLD